MRGTSRRSAPCTVAQRGGLTSFAQKPFPDKSFYVYDGKPYCAYHYHEVNNSLCRAPTCGQPIEGPCAVSHNGDRYHPDHFLCEHPHCQERLKEYWEVGGRVYCEKHAAGVPRDDEDDEDEDVPLGGLYNAQRATKRVTRFIDLGLGLGGGSAAAGEAKGKARAKARRLG